MSVPWSKLSNGTSSVSAPGPPDSTTQNSNNHVNEKRMTKMPKKLEQKLKEFDSNSGDVDGISARYFNFLNYSKHI